MSARGRQHTPTVHLTCDQQIWVMCGTLRKPFEISSDAEEPPEQTEYRRAREQRAVKGDIAALADLIRLDAHYLKTDRAVETVRVLRSEARFAKTLQERNHAIQALRLLGQALGAGDLRGRQPYPPARHIAILYDLLLPAYQQAKLTGSPSPPVSLPDVFCDYFPEGRSIPKGITSRQTPPPRGGRIALTISPSFTIPASDLVHLKEERPSELALARIAAIFGLGSGDPSDAIDWIRKLVQQGRRERKGQEEKQ